MGWSEFWAVLLLFLIFCGFLIFIYYSEPSPLPKICEQQCAKQDMNFYKYNIGGYQNAACLCKTKEDGLIKTIYVE